MLEDMFVWRLLADRNLTVAEANLSCDKNGRFCHVSDVELSQSIKQLSPITLEK